MYAFIWTLLYFFDPHTFRFPNFSRLTSQQLQPEYLSFLACLHKVFAIKRKHFFFTPPSSFQKEATQSISYFLWTFLNANTKNLEACDSIEWIAFVLPQAFISHWSCSQSGFFFAGWQRHFLVPHNILGMLCVQKFTWQHSIIQPECKK